MKRLIGSGMTEAVRNGAELTGQPEMKAVYAACEEN